MSGNSAQLPACSKCRIRKVRCDRRAPKCSNCTKGSVACIMVDSVTGKQYTRDYIRQLESQEARLRERQHERALHNRTTTSGFDSAEHTPQGPLTGETSTSHGGFVGDGSGLGFLHHILSEAKWQRHRTRILEQLADRPQMARNPISPNDLPSLHEAEEFLENYFTRFHIHHTFLMREDVLSIFNRIYGPPPPSDGMTSVTDLPNAQDKFRILMVFAISAITRFRAGLCVQNPYGYYMAAQAFLGDIPLIKDIEAIQNLLLIARFGMYYHIGCSLWEISQVCMRQCIELGLHIKPLKRLEPLLEQHHRRIFWECYVLDRYSSGILGRPFAICEKDITVLLPINAYDHSIAATGAVELDSIPENQVEVLTDVTIFIVFIRLRMISSRIHLAFYTGKRPGRQPEDRGQVTQSIGHVFAAFSRFRTQLDLWRSTVPVFSSPRSLYERSDWHDFMYYKDMLLLTRGAMQSLPSLSTSASSITTDVLVACYTSARRVIQLYADLMDQRAITWTRSYFQVIFTAGLTVIYSISLEVLKRDGCEMHSQHDAIETLARCSEILNHFREHMPDAGSFTIVFDLLKDECIADKLDDTNSALGFNQRSEGFPGSIGTHMGFTLQDVNISNENVQHIDTGVNDVGLAVYDLGFGLTDNFITQLEVGLGEYAWGSAPADGSFWDQLFF